MIVVADTSPFIVLVKIGRVDLFPTLFGRVVVPPEVVTELQSPDWPDAVRTFAASDPFWLEVHSPAVAEPIPGLQAGETAAIGLARENHPSLLVIDEAKGRRAAVARGIDIVGTVGMLERAAKKRLVDLADEFDRVKQTDFWVAHDFLDERLALFREWERLNPPPG